MSTLKQLIKRFIKDDTGASMAEYGLLIALIAVVCLAAVTLLGTAISSVFNEIALAI